jgi:hypothetical protein
MNFFSKTFQITLLLILIAELFSFCGYILPAINSVGFFVIILLVLAASIYRLEYGLLAVLAELFIGSKGYLFHFDFYDNSVSIRIAVWLILMTVWFVKILISAFKNKKITFAFKQSSYSSYFLIFLLFIIIAMANGVINHNSLSNVFFDANGWFYLLLIFPVYEVVFAKDLNGQIENILQVFATAVLWLTAKTLFFVYLFSHFSFDSIYLIYRWLRTTGVGEVTLIQGGFYRVFFQSHIFLLIGFILLLLYIASKTYIKKSAFYWQILFLTLISSVNIFNFSRSNWLGLAAGMLALFLILIWQKHWRLFVKTLSLAIGTIVLSLLLIMALVYFPLPKPIGGFNTTDLLSSRAGEISGEAGASSRMALLPKLIDQIKTAPLLGRGFGATVTYKTSDPRILQQNPSGNYTTYAFEWGWLDIWLKFGFVGLLYYLFLLTKIFVIDNINIFDPKNFNNLKDSSNLIVISLSLGMIIIAIVSMVSPYTNHPLGLGYLVISTAILEKVRIRGKVPSG